MGVPVWPMVEPSEGRTTRLASSRLRSPAERQKSAEGLASDPPTGIPGRKLRPRGPGGAGSTAEGTRFFTAGKESREKVRGSIPVLIPDFLAPRRRRPGGMGNPQAFPGMRSQRRRAHGSLNPLTGILESFPPRTFLRGPRILGASVSRICADAPGTDAPLFGDIDEATAGGGPPPPPSISTRKRARETLACWKRLPERPSRLKNQSSEGGLPHGPGVSALRFPASHRNSSIQCGPARGALFSSGRSRGPPAL